MDSSSELGLGSTSTWGVVRAPKEWPSLPPLSVAVWTGAPASHALPCLGPPSALSPQLATLLVLSVLGPVHVLGEWPLLFRHPSLLLLSPHLSITNSSHSRGQSSQVFLEPLLPWAAPAFPKTGSALGTELQGGHVPPLHLSCGFVQTVVVFSGGESSASEQAACCGGGRPAPGLPWRSLTACRSAHLRRAVLHFFLCPWVWRSERAFVWAASALPSLAPGFGASGR